MRIERTSEWRGDRGCAVLSEKDDEDAIVAADVDVTCRCCYVYATMPRYADYVIER